MSSAPDHPPAPQRLAVDYIHAPTPQALLGLPETLAVFGFGALAPSTAAIDDPRYLRVPLSPLREAAAPYEVWRASGPVTTGRDGAVRYSHDGTLLFGVVEWEEPEGGILHASAQAYAAMAAFWRDSGYPHLLRIWNYFDAITDGDGDAERYRQFCVGRVQGLGEVDTRVLPAATAIGSREARSRDGRRVLWVCDAMHGNTESTANGYKTRRFANILAEVEQSFDLHAAAGTRLGGVHLELTGEDVTECTGGARELTEVDLERAYRSTVDPRLNYEQSLEIAMAIVRKRGARRNGG